jgi:hypothetical protein
MNIGRAILVALIALSVAMLPVAGNVARAMSTEAAFGAAHVDCCPHGKPCDKGTTNDCDSMAGCALKCFSFSGAVVAPSAVNRAELPTETSALVVQSFSSSSDNPPLPPPRV